MLTAHLAALGHTLLDVASIQLVSGAASALGLLLAAGWTPRCGQLRVQLSVGLLLAALSVAALLLVPPVRRTGATLRPTSAEILCRPEGSVLFWPLCGATCDLNVTHRTELVVSDCRFEPQSALPARRWLDSIT